MKNLILQDFSRFSLSKQVIQWPLHQDNFKQNNFFKMKIYSKLDSPKWVNQNYHNDYRLDSPKRGNQVFCRKRRYKLIFAKTGEHKIML